MIGAILSTKTRTAVRCPVVRPWIRAPELRGEHRYVNWTTTTKTYYDVLVAQSVETLTYNTYTNLFCHFRVQIAPPQKFSYLFFSSSSIYSVSFIFIGLFRLYIQNDCDFISFTSSLHTIYSKMVTLLFHREC